MGRGFTQYSLSFKVTLEQWWFVFPVALALTIGFAALSWHLVEKPLLRLKKFFKSSAPKGYGPKPFHDVGAAPHGLAETA